MLLAAFHPHISEFLVYISIERQGLQELQAMRHSIFDAFIVSLIAFPFQHVERRRNQHEEAPDQLDGTGHSGRLARFCGAGRYFSQDCGCAREHRP
jgi:hypothetical protein